MPGNDVFEYAIVRVVPRVEREEFLNAGIILYCPAQKFLHSAFDLNEPRLCALNREANIQEIKGQLRMFEHVCSGNVQAGAISELPAAERFRWLTSARSTVVQTSPVHTGFCTDAQETLNHLLETLVRIEG